MLALVAAALLAADAPPAPRPDDATLAAYQRAKAAAPRTPDAQVRLAYWCEAHALPAERLRHLAQAVLADPNHAAARGLLGLVARADRWVRPDAVAEQVNADAPLAATLAEYDARRAKAPYTADGQLAVARWAEERGLKDQARAHYTAVVRLDPGREVVWKKLGYKRVNGRWTTDAEVAAARADAEAQKAADQRWRPLLERWKAMLGKAATRGEAEARLLDVVAPRAVPMIAKVFGTSSPDGPILVQLLGQIDTPVASKLLASAALTHPSAGARRVAIEVLRRRDPREYAHLLIPLLHKPIKYEVKAVNGPGSPGALFVEGDTANVKRLYEPRTLLRPDDHLTLDRFGQPVVERVMLSWSSDRLNDRGEITHGQVRGYQASYSDSFSGSSFGLGTLGGSSSLGTGEMANWDKLLRAAGQGNPGESAATLQDLGRSILQAQPQQHGSPSSGVSTDRTRTLPAAFDAAFRVTAEYSLGQVLAEQQRSALMSQRQLESDVAQVVARNRSIEELNDRVVGILNSATGASLSADPGAWQGWWIGLLGYAQVAGQTEQNPTFVEVIPSDYQPEVLPSNVVTQTFAAQIVDCFAAGTPIRTMTGPRPIEQLRVGDMVLTQKTSTGALGYQPITVMHRNPPASTFRVRLAGDDLLVSQYHRFWVARRGWVMARDLKAGDPIRTLGGVRTVESVEAGPTQLVYNLDVAEDADFFAGASAALVHDNTLPDPRLVPFDLPQADPKLAVAK